MRSFPAMRKLAVVAMPTVWPAPSNARVSMLQVVVLPLVPVTPMTTILRDG